MFGYDYRIVLYCTVPSGLTVEAEDGTTVYGQCCEARSV